MTANDSMSLYIDELLKEKFGLDVPAEELAEMKQELLEKLNTWITTKTMSVLANISPETLEEYQTLAQNDGTTPDQLQAYVAGKIPDTTTFLTQALMDFRITYLGNN